MAPAAAAGCCCCGRALPLLLLLPVLICAADTGAPAAVMIEVFLEQESGVSAVLQGELVESSGADGRSGQLEGRLVLLQAGDEDEEEEEQQQQQPPWIGLVPVNMDDSKPSTGKQESFADFVVTKMKRALVLGASALIILALNHNTLSEVDLSPVLSKPVIVVQTSENVTKLIGALLRGLRATAHISYRTVLQHNLGATLTLWSSCGRSRGGLYGEWQGVICTGESKSQVQKYLQQLWDTVLLVALFLCTGVIVQARRQHQHPPLNENELLLKQDVLRKVSLLKTKVYRRQPRPAEHDMCAVCLEPLRNNQCVRELPCLHEYHPDCVDPWLLLQHTCPLCKRSILGSVCVDS